MVSLKAKLKACTAPKLYVTSICRQLLISTSRNMHITIVTGFHNCDRWTLSNAWRMHTR